MRWIHDLCRRNRTGVVFRPRVSGGTWCHSRGHLLRCRDESLLQREGATRGTRTAGPRADSAGEGRCLVPAGHGPPRATAQALGVRARRRPVLGEARATVAFPGAGGPPLVPEGRRAVVPEGRGVG